MSVPHVAIVGAGIAGLTAALAFARNGITATVIEQADALSVIGAGLQLSPNACHVLERLGVLPAIEARWLEINHVALVSGVDFRRLTTVPAGSFARRRWKAPYGVLARADLQAVLLEAVAAQPGCRIVLDRRPDTSSVDALRNDIHAIIGAPPALIVGADGVHSAIRRLVPRHGTESFSGYVAWRMTVEHAEAASLPVPPDAAVALLGPSTHLVAYPMVGTGAVNLVAVTRDLTAQRAGGADVGRLRRTFRRWHPAVGALFDGDAGKPVAWPLFEVSGGAWRSGRLVLIGDAAHAMMPFAAQGAAMAIEDAFELAEAFAEGDQVIDAFVARRRARIANVRRRTAFNRFAYHARGPLRVGRDAVLALRAPERIAADLDWLYGYRLHGVSRSAGRFNAVSG